MTGKFRDFSAPCPPPPAPYGGERDTITIRADYILHLIADLNNQIAKASHLDWVSNAANSYRSDLSHVRIKSNELADEVGIVRQRIVYFVDLYDDIDRLVSAAEAAVSPMGFR